MTRQDLEIVEVWLMRRFKTCTTEAVAGFLINPTPEKILGANQLYARLLAEAKHEQTCPI